MNQKKWRAQYKYYLQSAYRLWQQVSGAGSCAASAGVTSVTIPCHAVSRRLCVTRCCHTLLSHGGKLLLSPQINVWLQTALGRRDNAQLLRIIHLLNRLSGFISVTCSRVQHLPRDTCPAVSPTLQQMALCCVVHRAWQPHVWAADKAYWYENWNI